MPDTLTLPETVEASPTGFLINRAAELLKWQEQLRALNYYEDTYLSMAMGETAHLLVRVAAGVDPIPHLSDLYRDPALVEAYARLRETIGPSEEWGGEDSSAERIRATGHVNAFWGAPDEELT